MQRWQAGWPVTVVVVVLAGCGGGGSGAPGDAAPAETGVEARDGTAAVDVRPLGPDVALPAIDLRPVDGPGGGPAVDAPASVCPRVAAQMITAPPGGLPGVPAPAQPNVFGDPTKLKPEEIVGRLSRFIWRSEPDAALLARVQGCDRLNLDDVRALANLTLRDPRAGRGIQAFVTWWLELDRLAAEQRNPASFPPLTDQLRRSMAEEVRLFAAHVVFNDVGTLRQLLTAPYSFVDRPLATIYGLPAMDDSFRQVDFRPADERAGLLTMPGVLAASGGFDRHSGPVRGRRLLERVLCSEVPPPPPNLPPQVPPPSERPGQTLRQAMERTLGEPVCAGCHAILEVGFAFEPFDAIGQHRTTDNGGNIDSRVQLRDPQSSGAFTVAGPVDLVRQLADLESTHRCFASRWLEFAVGRPALDQHPFVVDALTRTFKNDGLHIRALIVQVTLSLPFLAP